MQKHRGFPSRLPGTDFQFTIRRADEGFLVALIAAFGDAPFERGNLDAGRLSWLIGREVVAVDEPFDPASYAARLQVDLQAAQIGFPAAFDDLPHEAGS